MGTNINPEIGDLYRQKGTLAGVVAEAGGTIGSVRNALIRLGVPRHHRGNQGIPMPPREELVELVHGQKLTDPQIGEIYKRHKSIVQRWRKAYDIDTRWSLTNPRKKK